MILTIKSGNTNCFLLQDEVTSNVALIDAGHAADKGFIAKLQATQLIHEIDLLTLWLNDWYGMFLCLHTH